MNQRAIWKFLKTESTEVILIEIERVREIQWKKRKEIATKKTKRQNEFILQFTHHILIRALTQCVLWCIDMMRWLFYIRCSSALPEPKILQKLLYPFMNTTLFFSSSCSWNEKCLVFSFFLTLFFTLPHRDGHKSGSVCPCRVVHVHVRAYEFWKCDAVFP